ncbi:glycoside hydrolase family 13 protein [Salegentibacter sp. HM20]
MKKIVLFICLFVTLSASAQVERVEPPHWYAGFEDEELQLMLYGKNIGKAEVSLDAAGVELIKVHRVNSENYLFLDLVLTENSAPEKLTFNLELESGASQELAYEIKERSRPEAHFKGFDNTDAIYLITPDRFANGDPSNDEDPSLREKKIDRDDDYGRHGGDIRGIINHLDYIEEMGFTALWSSPLLINDMESGSYHGYAMTDFYQVDPRFGTLEEYIELADKARNKGIKLIMDQVANHIGSGHWWMDDLPFKDWLNYQEDFEAGKEITKSNHVRTTNQDFYAAEVDRKQMNEGWFVDTMPDLNQENPFMAKYLIQNSIWWIEVLGLGGIRQDTYPYPDKAFMSEWAGAIMKEYPDFNIVGEEWSYNPLLIRYWQDGTKNKDGYESNLRSTMDFAMQGEIVKGLSEEEGWGSGLNKIYEALANDFAYERPEDIMIFPDNHDKSRIYTQLGEDMAKTKMAVAYMLVLPRTPQIYYGTEILMDDTAKPGDHGLIRTEFPGGWDDHDTNAFTGEGLAEDKLEMQNFLKKLLNYRKTSEAIHSGKTKHFAPQDGVYVLARQIEAEDVVIILNKNEEAFELDLERFSELGLEGKNFSNIISGEKMLLNNQLNLPERGVYLFTTKIN